MLNAEKMQEVANAFLTEGLGLVALAGFVEDGDLKFRCFSTVCKEDVYRVLDVVSENVSMMPFDVAALMNGDFVATSGGVREQELARWGADHVDREEPLIIACVAEGAFAAFAVGDAPMLVYMAVRMLTTLKKNGDINPYPFALSDN